MLLPYDEHFHPTTAKNAKPALSKKPDLRKSGAPMVAVNVLPHEEQIMGNAMLEKWDYCLRKLFVLKGQSVKAAIGYAMFPDSLQRSNVDLIPPFVLPRIGRWRRGLNPSSNR